MSSQGISLNLQRKKQTTVDSFLHADLFVFD